MSTLLINGIKWEITTEDGNIVYTHSNIRITWEPKTETWRSHDSDGNLIVAREIASDCIQATTVSLLDAYADMIVPLWESYGEEEKEVQEDEESSRITQPDIIFELEDLG